MGAIAALLALGGIVALAAYSASGERRTSDGRPQPGASPLPPLTLPSGSSSASAQTHSAPADPFADPGSPVVPAVHTELPPVASNAPPDLVERVRAFMASDPSPEQIEALAAQLETAGLPDAARQLRVVAATRRQEAARQANAAPAPAPSPSPGPSSPAGTPGTSSSSATDSASSSRPAEGGETPSGRQLAAQTADALRTRLAELQRLTRSFQEAANIDADGHYGPMTRAALTYWMGRTAPRPWVGSGSPRYRGMRTIERGDGSDAANWAEQTGRALFRALLEPEGDAKPIVERFQRAVGLTVDGKYGRRTRAALTRLGANPPRAFRRTRARASSRRRSG